MPKQSKYKAPESVEKELRKEMMNAVYLMFTMYESEGHLTFESIGQQCYLHPRTLQNLYYGVTKFPQFRTIAKMAAGLNLSVQINQNALTLELVTPTPV